MKGRTVNRQERKELLRQRQVQKVTELLQLAAKLKTSSKLADQPRLRQIRNEWEEHLQKVDRLMKMGAPGDKKSLRELAWYEQELRKLEQELQ